MTRARLIEKVIEEWTRRDGDFAYSPSDGKGHMTIGITINDVEVEETSVSFDIPSLASAIDAEFDGIAAETSRR